MVRNKSGGKLMIGVGNKILLPRKSTVEDWLMDDITTQYYSNDAEILDENNNSYAAEGFTFSHDGHWIFIKDDTHTIRSYYLSTAWDIATMSYSNLKYHTYIGSHKGHLWVNNDGTVLYVCNGTGKSIYKWSMSTPFDITTLAYAGSRGNGGYVYQMYMRDNGNIFVDGTQYEVSGYRMAKYDDWNDSSRDYSFDIGSYHGSIFLKSDGTKAYNIYGPTTGYIMQYSLTTPWDITTLTYQNGNYSQLQYSYGHTGGLFFKPDGTKFFTSYGSYIIEYSLTA